MLFPFAFLVAASLYRCHTQITSITMCGKGRKEEQRKNIVFTVKNYALRVKIEVEVKNMPEGKPRKKGE